MNSSILESCKDKAISDRQDETATEINSTLRNDFEDWIFKWQRILNEGRGKYQVKESLVQEILQKCNKIIDEIEVMI